MTLWVRFQKIVLMVEKIVSDSDPSDSILSPSVVILSYDFGQNCGYTVSSFGDTISSFGV